VTVENTGNADLSFPLPGTTGNNTQNPSISDLNTSNNPPTLGADFSLNSSGSTACPVLTSSSSAAATLSANASCTLSISFIPATAGSFIGSVVLTDTNLNAVSPNAVQPVSFNGVATAVPITATTAIASAILTVGHAATAFTPVTASGGTGTLTYSVAPALPAGMVFSATGTVSGTPTAVSAATTYTVTVTDSNSATSTATFSLTVNAAITATTASSSTMLTVGHAATAFTPVTASGGTGALTYSVAPALPAGMVFSATGTVSGTPTAVSAATTYTVTATDANSATATATFSLTVNAVPITTTTGITANTLTPTYGTMVVLTANVTPVPTDTVPGTVSFYAGSSLLGTSPLNSGGVASLSIVLPLRPNAATAVYSGSSLSAGSSSSTLSISNRAGISIGLSASPTTQLYNNPVVLTVQTSSTATGTPTGTVSFLDGTTVLATVPLGSNGQATYSVTTLANGSHSLTATYSGDAYFQPGGSTGAAIAITIGNLNLDLGADQNQSVLPGATVAYKFPLSPLVTPTFLYDVHLTATGLPPGATYTFSPALIPAGSASLPVTMTIQTAKGVASLGTPATSGRQGSPRGLTALAFGLLLPLFGAKRVRRRLKALPRPLTVLLFTVLSLGAMAGMTGCGAGGYFGATAASGKYTITVTATSADLVRTSTVQLTIQ
jgi:hypothetical protein